MDNPRTRLGRYEIASLSGAGGMGEVYLARGQSLRPALHRPRALVKFIQQSVQKCTMREDI